LPGQIPLLGSTSRYNPNQKCPGASNCLTCRSVTWCNCGKNDNSLPAGCSDVSVGITDDDVGVSVDRSSVAALRRPFSSTRQILQAAAYPARAEAIPMADYTGPFRHGASPGSTEPLTSSDHGKIMPMELDRTATGGYVGGQPLTLRTPDPYAGVSRAFSNQHDPLGAVPDKKRPVQRISGRAIEASRLQSMRHLPTCHPNRQMQADSTCQSYERGVGQDHDKRRRGAS